MQTSSRLSLALGALGLLALGATGCNGPSISQYCTDAMECRGGNQFDTKACVVDGEAVQKKAEIYGCKPEYDAYLDCVFEKSTCEGTSPNKVYTTFDFQNMQDKCELESKELLDCQNNNSSLDSGVQ